MPEWPVNRGHGLPLQQKSQTKPCAALSKNLRYLSEAEGTKQLEFVG